LQLARVLDQNHAVASLGDLREQRIDQRGLAGGGAAGDEDVAAFVNGGPQQFRLVGREDAARDVIIEGEDGDGRPPDGEAGGRDDRRDQALKPLPRPGKLGRHAR